ncbi:STM4015 family protein [Nocardiopsis dassonvillei]|uniref:STM4015 family protein n=1 Tax=Nocardiopsis dassonvillei TaxID=2014 RepID=UPI00200EFCD6|nr:STM4015 family protein [Nocardiopsis dassonvillei]MCK9870962.1 STM4015 family protein [Nocardiopsis dassonvillei]
MAFDAHLTEFAGLPVVGYRSPEGWAREAEKERERAKWRGGSFTDPGPYPPPALASALADPGSVAWRLSDDEEPLDDYRRFIAQVDQDRVAAVVLGDMRETFSVQCPDPLKRALLEVAPDLTGLRSLFYCDVTFEQVEVSWIELGDMAPVLDALPRLTEFAVRGTGEMSLHVHRHDSLRRLTLQGGGLPGRLTREIVSSGLPNLEHLELWLGVENYGGDTTPEDLAPVLSGEAFPALRSLGLRNAEHTDDWVPVLAGAPVTSRLHTLDLSLGTLTDKGARALVEAAPAFAHLKRLDLHHHYLSEVMQEHVRAAFAGTGVDVDLSEREVGSDWEDEDFDYDSAGFYTAVSE